ncbi:TetR/AcrR family transcriptional regulator [Candidatus Solincola tengchongensis]|uniref:TetR/AcrR family transcriptional regulator n=1 Tax=Candidatus Solincola tengchongensis TaxID=2900693 RepID=UPI00257CE132|nr:TetR/AcrR family transcriptional regulator [Candidatus Solincola tengchongensis]
MAAERKTLGLRRNPAKDEREQAFKRAALKFFSAKGYHRTTMSEIALEAGFGKGTLYWYWKSKEDLYFSLIEDMHREFLDLVERAAEREGNAWDKLFWLGREIIDLYYRDRDYCKLSWKMRAEELETFSPQHVERLYQYINRTKEKLQEIMAQGVEEGVFPPYDPYYLACMLMGLVEGMEIQWLEDSSSFDLRRAMDMAMEMLRAFAGGKAGAEAVSGGGKAVGAGRGRGGGVPEPKPADGGRTAKGKSAEPSGSAGGGGGASPEMAGVREKVEGGKPRER